MARKDDLGRRGEQLAVEHLTAIGWSILDRNWRCSLGELDIVADDGGTIVVVEVKTRSSIAYGHPLDAVTPRKLARVRRLAAAWCAASPTGGLGRLRIDVIGVVLSAESTGRETVALDHLRQVC